MNDPLAALLDTQTGRTTAAHELGEAHEQLVTAIDRYRSAWRKATSLGWARTQLTRAGLTAPAHHGRATRRRPDRHRVGQQDRTHDP